MKLKITPKQFQKYVTLIHRLCCNYDDGNCIALDNGEPFCCIQEISECSIYCNYFRDAVLSADKKLYEKILKHNKEKP